MLSKKEVLETVNMLKATKNFCPFVLLSLLLFTVFCQQILEKIISYIYGFLMFTVLFIKISKYSTKFALHVHLAAFLMLFK